MDRCNKERGGGSVSTHLLRCFFMTNACYISSSLLLFPIVFCSYYWADGRQVVPNVLNRNFTTLALLKNVSVTSAPANGENIRTYVCQFPDFDQVRDQR
jgi:hypothetical protein